MAEMEKKIGYVMAPENSFYDGQVMRRVTTNLSGVTVTLSETTTGMDFEGFMEANPDIPVDGRSAMSLKDDVSRMTDEQLATMGLVRTDGTKQQTVAVVEDEVLEVKFNYPVHEGFGVYLFSDGTRKKMEKPARANAIAKQTTLDKA